MRKHGAADHCVGGGRAPRQVAAPVGLLDHLRASTAAQNKVQYLKAQLHLRRPSVTSTSTRSTRLAEASEDKRPARRELHKQFMSSPCRRRASPPGSAAAPRREAPLILNERHLCGFHAREQTRMLTKGTLPRRPSTRVKIQQNQRRDVDNRSMRSCG